MSQMVINEVACGDGNNEEVLRVAFQFLFFPEAPKTEDQLQEALRFPMDNILNALRRLEQAGFITSRLEMSEKENPRRETVRNYRLTRMVSIIISNEPAK